MTENGKQERFSLRNDGMNVEGARVGPPVSGFLSWPLRSLWFFVQAAGGGEHGRSRGAETEDRAAPEGEEESAGGQQHDAPATLFQVRCWFHACVLLCLCAQSDTLSACVHPQRLFVT